LSKFRRSKNKSKIRNLCFIVVKSLSVAIKTAVTGIAGLPVDAIALIVKSKQ